jgi:hypothetical protein
VKSPPALACHILSLVLLCTAPFEAIGATTAKRTTPWAPVSAGANIPADAVLRVVDDQGRAWITTYEPIVGSQGTPYIAFLEAGGLRVPNGGLNGYVDRLAVDRYRGGVVAQGRFERSGSQPVSGLAHWSGSAWTELGGGLPPDALVTAMALDAGSGDVFIAGRLTTLGGVRIDGLARWSAASRQWTALPSPSFEPDHLAWDADAGTLVAAGTLFDNLAVLSGGAWEAPRLQNGDSITIREIDDLLAVPGQGVYIIVRTRAFGPPSAFRGEPLFRVSGRQVIEDLRVRGFFGQVSWDRTRNELVVCCGRADGMPDSNVALRLAASGVSAFPDPFPGFGPWEGARLAAGGSKAFVGFGRGNALEFASWEAGGWVRFGNSINPQQGQPVWNPVTRELFVRSAGTVDLVVRSGDAWSVVEPPEPDVLAEAVSSAGADGTVIAGRMTSDQLFVGRWRQGRWIEQRVSPTGFAALQGVNDVVWDSPNQRYLLAGNIVILENGVQRYHHVLEVDASGWRPLDVGVPADGRIARVFGLEAGGCPHGILAFGDLSQWGGQAASGAGCIVGRNASPYPGLPQSTVFATVAGPGPGVRHFWMVDGILRRDASGDRYVGRPEGSTALVRDLIADEQTGSLIAVGAFLGIDGVQANSVARLTRFGWVAVPGVTPHADLRATWIEEQRRLVAGSVRGEQSFSAPAVALAQARINLPPRITAVGSIVGTPEVGQALTYGVGAATDGDGDAVRLQWRWLREGVPIPGAVGTTYVVQREDRGRSISVELTASDDEEIDRLRTTALAVVNRLPSRVSGRIVGMEDEGLRVSLATFGTTASDPDGDPLELTASALPTGWRVDRVDAVTLILLPPSGYVGESRLPIALCDDLRACTTGSLDVAIEPRLMARPDRIDLPWGATEVMVDVLANDLFMPSRLAGGRIAVLGVTGPGSAQVDLAGTPADASDDRLVFRIDRRESTETRIEYLLCETASLRCSESEAVLLRGVFGSRPISIATTRDRGHHDLQITGLQGLRGVQVQATGIVRTEVRELNVAADPSPSTPWDGAGAALTTGLARVSASGTIDVQVWAEATSGSALDLYVGLDTNGDGRASRDEMSCSAVSSGASKHCAIRRTDWRTGAPSYWVLAHARSGPGTVRIETSDASDPLAGAGLVATAPVMPSVAGDLPVKLVWNDPTLLPGDVRTGRIALSDAAGVAFGSVSVRIVRSAGEPVAFALRPGAPYRFDLAPAGRHERLYIDVPPGLERMLVVLESDADIELRASRLPELVPDRVIPEVTRAPAAGANDPVVRTAAGRLSLEVSRPVAGRWYLAPLNRGASRASAVVTATFVGAASVVRPGGYFNPERTGSGLFILPAGADAAAIWYTYDDAGRPTWYFVQGAYANVAHGWSGTLHRSVWMGDRNRLVEVGRATLMPKTSGGVSFSYLLDGEAGAEAYEWFGSGCPSMAGAPLDLSGHWFDPARAGSGYSVQMLPNYEFILLFVYDANGESRFLVAEFPGFGPPVREIAIQQTSGSCPLCPYAAPSPRAEVGRLRRTISGGALVEMDVQTRFAAGLPGRWDVVDRIIPLAGSASLQGCVAP